MCYCLKNWDIASVKTNLQVAIVVYDGIIPECENYFCCHNSHSSVYGKIWHFYCLFGRTNYRRQPSTTDNNRQLPTTSRQIPTTSWNIPTTSWNIPTTNQNHTVKCKTMNYKSPNRHSLHELHTRLIFSYRQPERTKCDDACLGVTCSAVLTEVAFQFFLALFSSF